MNQTALPQQDTTKADLFFQLPGPLKNQSVHSHPFLYNYPILTLNSSPSNSILHFLKSGRPHLKRAPKILHTSDFSRTPLRTYLKFSEMGMMRVRCGHATGLWRLLPFYVPSYPVSWYILLHTNRCKMFEMITRPSSIKLNLI